MNPPGAAEGDDHFEHTFYNALRVLKRPFPATSRTRALHADRELPHHHSQDLINPPQLPVDGLIGEELASAIIEWSRLNALPILAEICV
jgi:hypothetical protein